MDKIDFKSNLKVSVIIPTYNRPRTLRKVIKSYILSCDELIIINDGSTKDYSLTINFIKKECEKYRKNFKYIQNKKRKGSGYSRNVGLRYTSFNLVLFSDDDIFISSNYISECIRTLYKYNASVVGGRIIYLEDKKNLSQAPIIDLSILEGNFSISPEKNYLEVPFLHVVSLWDLNRTFRKGVRFFPYYFVNGYREETDPMIQVTKKGGKILFISHIKCYHLPKNKIERGGQKRVIRLIYWLFIHFNNLIFLIRHYRYLRKLTKSFLLTVWLKRILNLRILPFEKTKKFFY